MTFCSPIFMDVLSLGIIGSMDFAQVLRFVRYSKTDKTTTYIYDKSKPALDEIA